MRRVTRRLPRPHSLLVLVGLSVFLAVGMTWPLTLHFGSELPSSPGDPDPLIWTWSEAWIGHALLHQPFDLFQANRFWPAKDSLAFGEVSLGYAPAVVFTTLGDQAVIVVYNLIFLFAFALAFVGAFLLARELGACTLAAGIAGAAFAYAPFRIEHESHISVISSGGIPLALFLLVRGYRRRNGWLVSAGWLVTTWQVTLGFNLGLQLVYLLFAVGLVTTVYWLRRDRASLGRNVLAASLVGAGLLLFVTYLQARPYLRVAQDHPEATRSREEVVFLSPRIQSFLAAPARSRVWGEPTTEVRETVPWPYEQTLFPGLAILALALIGLASPAYPKPVRVWLGIGTVVCAALSLGLRDSDHVTGGFTPYRLLHEFAPGWDGIRTPGRINTLTSLGLALLAAAGVALFLSTVRTRPVLRTPFRTASRREAAALLTAGCVMTIVLLEGAGRTPHTPPPEEPPGQVGAADPLLHLPSTPRLDDLYAWWSIGDFPRMANGHASFEPGSLALIRRITASFPDEKSVAYIRALGLRTVILHPDLAHGTPWANAAAKPVKELPLVREDKGDVILFHVEPPGPPPSDAN